MGVTVVLDEQQLIESVDSLLGQNWPETTRLQEADLPGLWSAAVAEGWFSYGPDELSSVLLISRRLGRAASHLPVAEGWIAAQIVGGAGIADGTMRVGVVPAHAIEDDTARYVEGADALTHVLVLPTGAGCAQLRAAVSFQETPGVALPAWSNVRLGEVEEEAELDAVGLERAHADLRLVHAVRAMGAASRSHELSIDHANTRVQFGKPIGAYQAVSHRIVNTAIEVAVSEHLTAEAMRLRLLGDDDAALASELVVAHALDQASNVQFEAGHTLAAMGFFEEHPAPWLFRRVHADLAHIRTFPLAAGSVADQLLEGGRRLPRVDAGEVGERFRSQLIDWMEQVAPGGGRGRLSDIDPAVVTELVESGLIGMDWPAEYGGRAARVEEAMVLSEEVDYHRLPGKTALGAADLLGRSIIRFGTPEQKERFLPLIKRGELHFYLGYSEPAVGSDLASLQTTAVRDGDEWVINGTKKWGTATRAEYVWLAARTDPEATPRHAGISVFLFRVEDLPGFKLERITALTGETHAVTHFDNVRVPTSALVGEVNGGWKVIVSALAAERVVMGGLAAGVRRLFDELLDILRQDGNTLAGGPGSAARAEITRLATRLQAARVLVNISQRAFAAGAGDRVEAPMAKIVGTTVSEQFAQFATDLLGPASLLSDESPESLNRGRFEYALRIALMNTVGGGTNDIQRNQVARGLGLPRG